MSSVIAPLTGAVASGPATVVAKVATWIPPTLVVSALAAVGWYGHNNHWQLPKFSAVTGRSVEKEPGWCDSHGVLDADCINCRPSLLKDKQTPEWCAIHGVHFCVLERPTVAELLNFDSKVQTNRVGIEQALLSNRNQNVANCSYHTSLIQFGSVEAIQKAGVDVEPVFVKSMTEVIEAVGEIRYDATKVAQVAPRVDGTITHVLHNVGDWVDQGTVLAVVDSAAVGKAKAELLDSLASRDLTRSNIDRLAPHEASGAIPVKRLVELKSELQLMNVRVDQCLAALGNLGVQVDVDLLQQATADRRARLLTSSMGWSTVDGPNGPSQTASATWVPIVSPITDRIIERNVVRGEMVNPQRACFVIADTRAMTLELRVAAEKSSRIALGQPVEFLPDGASKSVSSKIVWISTSIDPKTRTITVRAPLESPTGEYRNETFGRGEVILRSEPNAVVVPNSALQSDGHCIVAFIRDRKYFEPDRPKFFYPRSVRVGVSKDGFTEILAGIAPGEVVVSQGTEVLRAQMLKSSLGAGCTCCQ